MALPARTLLRTLSNTVKLCAKVIQTYLVIGHGYLLDSFIFVLLMAVSLATINVNGIAEAPKRAKVFHSLLSSNFDIFLLQETQLSSDVHRNVPKDLDRNFSVLKKCMNKFDCLVYEMLLIRELTPSLNIQSDSIQAKLFT